MDQIDPAYAGLRVFASSPREGNGLRRFLRLQLDPRFRGGDTALSFPRGSTPLTAVSLSNGKRESKAGMTWRGNGGAFHH